MYFPIINNPDWELWITDDEKEGEMTDTDEDSSQNLCGGKEGQILYLLTVEMSDEQEGEMSDDDSSQKLCRWTLLDFIVG